MFAFVHNENCRPVTKGIFRYANNLAFVKPCFLSHSIEVY